jgi:hypothetical protein
MGPLWPRPARQATSLFIPPNVCFIYLNNEQVESETFKTSIHPHEWTFFNNPVECQKFITTHPMNSIVLITSGRLGQDLIEQMHDLPQLCLIYIYCRQPNKYKHLAKNFKKVHSPFVDPNSMLVQMRLNLDKQRYNLPRSVIANETIAVQEQQVPGFCLPGTRYCPWNENTCTKSMPVKGKGTIEMSQKDSLPFELFVSTKSKADDPDAFALVLKVDNRESILGLFQNGSLRVLQRTTRAAALLQPNNGKWETYWLSYFKDKSMVKYGVGEVRPSFFMLEFTISAEENSVFAEIQHLHIKLNNENRLNQIGDLRNNVKIVIGPEPVTFEPAVLVLPLPSFTLEHASHHTALTPVSLDQPCRELYESVINFPLNDLEFSQLTKAIEESIKTPDFWCYKKLREKSRGTLEATYLRITVGQLEGRSPGHRYVVEIWPPGHYSSIHNHSNVYGIIRVLYGTVTVKLYPSLSVATHEDHTYIEKVFTEGQVTWISPRLNQTHQVSVYM